MLRVPDERPENMKENATCGIQFITAALNVILMDQMNDLNPNNEPLHKTFTNAIRSMENLKHCINKVLGHHCQHPTKPQLPEPAFDRKQWSVGVIKASEKFLRWFLKDRLYFQTNKLQHL